MNREEAIKRFQRMKKIFSIPNSDAKRTIEAIDMAIKALKTEPTNTDLISRADAIEALMEQYYWDEKDYDTAIETINELPSADAVSREDYHNLTVGEKIKLIQDLLGVEFKEENLNYEHATLVDIKEPLKVEVVRCKDCRHYKKINPRAKSGMCYKDIVASAWNDDGFCSKGERREE